MFQNKYSKLIHSTLLWILSGGTLLFPLFVFPKTGETINLPKTFFLFIWVSITILLWSASALFEKKIILRRSMLDVPLLLLLLLCIISGAISVSQGVSFLGTTENFTLTLLVLVPSILFCYILIQFVRTKKIFHFLLQLFCGANICATLAFSLFQLDIIRSSQVFASLGEKFFQTVSSSNSIFGIWVATLGVLSVGMLLLKDKNVSLSTLPAVSAVLSFITLFRLGFDVAFFIYALGLAVLLFLPFLFIKYIRFPVTLVTFFVFLITLVTLIFDAPSFIKLNLPVEIALGSHASADIVKGTLAVDVKQFLFGSGPGTFVYDFSLHRTPAFNTNAIVSETRFQFPFSTFFAFLSELGILGSLFFILLILIGGGALVSTWSELRTASQEQTTTSSHFADMFDVFVVGAAWLALTVGLFVSFVDLTTWWTWWCLLSLLIVGIGFVNKKFVVERHISLAVSPQYSLALSFGIIFFFTLLLLSVAFGVRLYLAEYFFTKASEGTSLTQSQLYVERAIAYRQSYAPYHISLSRIYLQKAKEQYEKQKQSPEVAELIALGGNQAHIASQIDPHNVETWETLALLYLNAGSFAPEAQGWAKEALRSAILLEPSNATNHFRLGEIYKKEGSYADAEKEYQQAIQLKFDSIPSYISLITLYREQGKLNEAIALYQPLLQLESKNADVLFNYGALFFNRHEPGDDEKAEKIWLETLKITPNHSNTLYSLGLLYERKGDKSKAVSYYQKVRELNPANDDVKKKIQSLLK